MASITVCAPSAPHSQRGGCLDCPSTASGRGRLSGARRPGDTFQRRQGKSAFKRSEKRTPLRSARFSGSSNLRAVSHFRRGRRERSQARPGPLSVCSLPSSSSFRYVRRAAAANVVLLMACQPTLSPRGGCRWGLRRAPRCDPSARGQLRRRTAPRRNPQTCVSNCVPVRISESDSIGLSRQDRASRGSRRWRVDVCCALSTILARMTGSLAVRWLRREPTRQIARPAW